jgi:hypothetical protein
MTLDLICNALGWQGGTIHQVLDEIARLRRAEQNALPQDSLGGKEPQVPLPAGSARVQPAPAYSLVYNKATKKIDRVRLVDGLVADSFEPPEECA